MMATDARDASHDSCKVHQQGSVMTLSSASTKEANASRGGSPPDSFQASDDGEKSTTNEVTGPSPAQDPNVPQAYGRSCQKNWQWRSLKELNDLDCDQLKQLCSSLSHLIKRCSFDLGPLLEEHHNLQEEVNARNIVIQQLLKLTCKNTELIQHPIQMSVIFPSDKDDDANSDVVSDA